MRSTGVLIKGISCSCAVALLLAACGGGGDGTETNPFFATLSVLAGESTGAGTIGSTDGTGSAARFNQPNGIAADSAGTLYVADTANFTIRKVTSAGIVTTFAGLAGTPGSTDGTSAARFAAPESVVTDSAGNVYVGDGTNHTVRKITTTGVVTTFAGTAGLSGSTDETGPLARFNLPRGIGIDGAGNLYVADALDNTIRMITPGAAVTTIAGLAGFGGSTNGTGTLARFNSPSGVAADGAGNIYVADTFNHTIRKITVTVVGGVAVGTVTTFAGAAGSAGTSDGIGSAARFFQPRGLTVDSSGNVYVADFGNSAIRKITPAGVVTTVVGVAGLGGLQVGTLPGRIAGPFGVAVVGSLLYIVTPNFSCVLRVTNRP